MKISISQYLRGITSLHNLMDLLLVSLVEVMPSVELGRVGATDWRGYVIRNYKNLAPGHYFCQIYPSKPTILLMEEFCNYGGRMFYPWRVDVDLIQTDFFERDVDGQRTIIVNFYKEAVINALTWQESAQRHAIVPRQIWNGKEYQTSAKLEYPKKVFRVTKEYITAIEQQGILFSKLKEVINELVVGAGMIKPYIISSTKGWKYRGLWMKLRIDEPENTIPEGSFPYYFKIDLYNHPEFLRYQDDSEERILNLAETYFFNLSDENQKATLSEFMKPIVNKLIQISTE